MGTTSNVTEVLRLTLVLSLPLVFNPWGASAFELPKAMLLRALVLLLGWVAVVERLERSPARARPRFPPAMVWPGAAFGLSVLAATLLSYDPLTSLWGLLQRQQGLLTLAAYLGLFWLTASQLRSRTQVYRLWSAVVWGSLPVVLYGLLQGFGVRPLGWQTDAASPVLSTVGRANFLGSYLVLIIPLTAARTGIATRPLPLILLLGGQLACWLLTLARGAWIGLGAAIVIGLLAWAYATRRRRLAWIALALTLGGASVIALVMALTSSHPVLTETPGLKHLTSLAQTNAGSVAARLTIWRTTQPLVAARPWLGYGPEAMWPIFMRVFPPELVYYHGRGVIVDRAHNLWLDLGMSVGLMGALAFAALLLATCGQIRRGLSPPTRRTERVLWVALAAALGGHLVDLQFSFDLTTTGTIFWLLLALVAALANGLEPERERPPFKFRLRYLPGTLIVFALIGQLCLRPLLADVAYWRSQQPARGLDIRLHEAERAVRLWPPEPQYRLGLAGLHAQTADCAAVDVQMAPLEARRPDDPQIWATYGAFTAQCGALAKAEMAWREAIHLAPNLGTYHRHLGRVLAERGKRVEATEALQRAVALDATDVAAYQKLAQVYQALGKEEAAQEATRQAEYWRKKMAE
jgi:O-antigen ligase